MSQRPDVNAKPAVVVGLEKARNNKRNTSLPQRAEPAPASGPRNKPMTMPPPPVHAGPPQPPPARSKPPTAAPPPRGRGPTNAPSRRTPPDIFDERTRAANPGEDVLAAIRSAPGPGKSVAKSSVFDEPTRLGNVDAAFLDQRMPADDGPDILDGATTADPRAKFIDNATPADPRPPKFLDNATPTDGRFLDAATEMSPSMFSGRTQPSGDPFGGGDEDKTRLSSVDSVARRMPSPPAAPARPPGARPGGKRAPLPRPSPGGNEERTRAVDISEERRRDPSINDVDWDLD
jgi:hypothetical protein